MNKRIQTYAEFWPFYLAEHSKPLTKKIHVVGTIFVIGVLIFTLVTQRWFCLLLTPLVGYSFAWYSHFFVEKNRPATFTYPLWSFISDFRLAYLYLRGKIK